MLQPKTIASPVSPHFPNIRHPRLTPSSSPKSSSPHSPPPWARSPSSPPPAACSPSISCMRLMKCHHRSSKSGGRRRGYGIGRRRGVSQVSGVVPLIDELYVCADKKRERGRRSSRHLGIASEQIADRLFCISTRLAEAFSSPFIHVTHSLAKSPALRIQTTSHAQAYCPAAGERCASRTREKALGNRSTHHSSGASEAFLFLQPRFNVTIAFSPQWTTFAHTPPT